jgi:hypothetical protein
VPERCPTCGAEVRAVTGGEGTSHYEPAPAAFPCPDCAGAGSIESSDSTDDRWWPCPRCEGAGKLADRRRDPARAGARAGWAPVEQVWGVAEALREAVQAARTFNRGGMTWMEYDIELVRLERLADDASK